MGFAVGDDDDDGIDAFVDAGFEEERHIVDYDGMGIFLCGLFGESRLFSRDAGVDDLFQYSSFCRMVEDDSAEGLTVDGAIRIEDGLPE